MLVGDGYWCHLIEFQVHIVTDIDIRLTAVKNSQNYTWIILNIQSPRICIYKANTSGFPESSFVLHSSMTSFLWRAGIHSVCLYRSLIRFLLNCQSQFRLDPFKQNTLIPKWPSITDHQLYSMQQAGKKINLDFQRPEMTPTRLSSSLFKRVWTQTHYSVTKWR